MIETPLRCRRSPGNQCQTDDVQEFQDLIGHVVVLEVLWIAHGTFDLRAPLAERRGRLTFLRDGGVSIANALETR